MKLLSKLFKKKIITTGNSVIDFYKIMMKKVDYCEKAECLNILTQ